MPKTYAGGCHCGKVRYEVEMDLESVVMCNCSMCAKRNWKLAFVPADAFTLHSGTHALTEYRFNTGHIAHLFCATCGVASFSRGLGADGKEMVSVNVCCLDGVDHDALPVHRYDGASA
ncbi:MAG: GFA family protein [Deltaproteobacteria bacterium]|nr:MAG: GFA family protein [Deltaproteobacteria bacterium]